MLDARAALVGAIVGVLQDGHQGECIGAAHYLAGRAPGAAAGGGRQLVCRALRSWPRCGSWKAVPTSIGSVAAVAGDVAVGQVLDARAALAGTIAVGVLQGGHEASASAPRTTWPGAHQVQLQMAFANWCAVHSSPGQGGACAWP